MLLNAEQSSLVVVDIQEKLISSIAQSDELISHCLWMIECAQSLDVPIYLSEQYSRGLGPTVSAIQTAINQAPACDKTTFSCYRSDGIQSSLDPKRQQVLLIGIEAHVCVMQSAYDLRQAGFEVYVVADAISSRDLNDKRLALRRMRDWGVHVISREMALFEWLRDSKHDKFKALSKSLLKG